MIELQLAALRLQSVARRQLFLGERDRRVLQLEVVEVAELARSDEADRLTGTARATGATGAVNVALGVLGERVVEDVADVRDVDATARDVGRDEKAQSTFAHPAEHALARRLGQVRRQRLGGEAFALQHRRDEVDLFAGVAEHQRRCGLFDRDDVEQIAGLHRARHRVVGVVDRRSGDVVTGEAQRDRRAHVATRDAFDLGRHRRGEQRRLPLARAGLEDRVDVLEEAHREHLVGLVEDDHAHARQIERFSANVIEHATGCADDGVHAGAKRRELGLHRSAAVDRQRYELAVACEPGQLVADLLRELARRRERDELHAGLGRVAGLEACCQPRHTERSGLAGAGLRLHEHVVTCDDRCERGGLHRRRLGPAELGDRIAQRLR